MSKEKYDSVLDLKRANLSGDLCVSARFKICILPPEFDNSSNYLKWMKNRDSNQFISGIDPAMTLMQLNQYISEKYSSINCLLLGIFTLDTNEHIGNIKFEPIDIKSSNAEVGILIGEENWRNRGVASEVLRTLLLYLSEELQITTFELGVNRINTPALKAYRNVGFVALDSDNISETL